MTPNLKKTGAGLILLGAVLLLAGMAFGVSSDDDPAKGDPIVGNWNCVVPANSVPCVAPDCFNVIKSFHLDGTMIEMDNVAAPSEESVVLGEWTRTGKHTYSASLEQFDFAGGTFHGTFHYSTPLTLSGSMNKLTGTFHATEVDPSGSVTDLGSGSVSCTRAPRP